MSEAEDTEREYLDPLTTAMGLVGGMDSGSLASWAESLRRADDALDAPIAALVREGELQRAQELAEQASSLQSCAAFLDLLYSELENPRVA